MREGAALTQGALAQTGGQGRECVSASYPAHSAPQEKAHKGQASTAPETGWEN